MKFQYKILKLFFKTVSSITPRLGGKFAFKAFQKVRKKSIRKREELFYKKAKHFKIPSIKEDISCYELGTNNQKLAFLIHGWESNAGSLSKFAFQLAERGYRVISFDLPGHAHAKSNYTNLFECKEAFKSLIEYIEPEKPFTVIAHSFGSAVSTYTLSNLNYEVDKFVFLTSPNSIYEVFTDFKEFIGLSDRSFSYVLKKAKTLLNEDVGKVSVDEKLKQISYSKLLLLHDEHDKIIPIKNSLQIKQRNIDKVELRKYQKIGHYRMLWNDNILDDALQFITV